VPISGVLLTCRPELLAGVSKSVHARPWSEVREARGNTLIVVTDTKSLQDDRREVEALEAMEGVVAAHVVFSNVEDLAEAQGSEERRL